MSKCSRSRLVLAIALALGTAAPVFAQSTSAGIAGQVTTVEGKPVANAAIEVLHVPSGTRTVITTDASGRYSTRGLRVGGPFAVRVIAEGMAEETTNDVFLRLDEVTNVNLALRPSTTELEAVTVTASASSDVFAPDNMGATTTITRQAIDAFPSIKRSLEDYVRFDPRVVQVDKERGGISGGGQNNRYNNIRIDGVPTNDQFGLNDSGVPSLNQPISIDWIQEFNIGISNYDVTQKDFVGVNINAVTKSGGNEFEGGVYGLYRNSDMVGDEPSDFTGFDDEWTFGGYVGGPIIQDRLYFFAGYEEFERSQPGASTCLQGQTCSNPVNVSQAELDQIRTIAAGYGLDDIGGQSATADNTDEKWFAKVDWNLNEDHRATFRYNKTEGSILRLNTSTTTLQLDSNYYEDNISFENYAFLLYSNWSDSFSTEANVSYAEYRSLPTAFAEFPQVSITVRPGASVLFGKERSRQANQLEVDTWTAYVAGDWFLGDHTIRLGLDYEKNDVFNLFLQDTIGSYTFPSITGFQNGTWSNYRLNIPGGGDINTVAANFDYSTPGVFLQDTWSLTPNLTVMYGFRLDQTNIPDEPKFNAGAQAAFGYDNTDLPDGDNTVQPRVGFNYSFDSDRPTQLRGGFGLFQGSAPGVWVSNSFSNPGGLATAYNVNNGTGVSFDPDNPLIPPTSNPAQLVNFLDPDFQQPTVWKANLAFEHELPWYNLIGGIEAIVTNTHKGVQFTHLNLGNPVGFLPDGRQYFFANVNPASFNGGATPSTRQNRNRAYTDVLLLSNTDAGKAENLTLTLEKPWTNDWYAKIGYTYSKADEVSPGTSSVALSNWQNRSVFNPNEEVESTANYEFRDRFTGLVSKRFNWFENAPTTFSMFFEGRSGRPYSYGFTGDANGDGVSGNDLFFVPGAGSVQYSSNSTAADIAAFQSFIENNSDLNGNRGQVVGRNTKRAPSVNQFDVRVSQEIPLFRDTRAELWLDVLNIGNMIDEEWGLIEEAAFPYNVGVARMAGVANGAYVYDVSNYVNDTTGVVNNPTLVRKDAAAESRWAIQVGFRFEF
jgi:hypothetical protein